MANSHNLIDAFMAPETQPPTYAPGDSVVAWCGTADPTIFVELYRRSDRTFGFRYRAWVAWRDAGGKGDRHGWHELMPDSNSVTDSIDTVRSAAKAHAASYGVVIDESWHPTSNDELKPSAPRSSLVE